MAINHGSTPLGHTSSSQHLNYLAPAPSVELVSSTWFRISSRLVCSSNSILKRGSSPVSQISPLHSDNSALDSHTDRNASDQISIQNNKNDIRKHKIPVQHKKNKTRLNTSSVDQLYRQLFTQGTSNQINRTNTTLRKAAPTEKQSNPKIKELQVPYSFLYPFRFETFYLICPDLRCSWGVTSVLPTEHSLGEKRGAKNWHVTHTLTSSNLQQRALGEDFRGHQGVLVAFYHSYHCANDDI